MKNILTQARRFTLIFTFLSAPALADDLHYLKYEDNGRGMRRLIEERIVGSDGAPKFGGMSHESSYPQFITEHQAVGPQRIVEVWSRNRTEAERIKNERALDTFEVRDDSAPNTTDELITIVETGNSANRIDLVFMGDGYTRAERQKFIEDIQRMVNDMFVGQTFASYLPVFNVYAVFRASNESGIGRNDRPKDTAYRLYREGNTLRAIYPGNTSALRASCRVAPGCDYPVVIANDPHYGGLGGEFAISTSSETSGTVVLRHELGHNFGRVGEEYDGGGYFGANSSASVTGLKWKHWATEAQTKAEPSKARFLAWPWHNLSRGSYTATFKSDANYPNAAIRFSASGFSAQNSLKIELNGQALPWESRGTDDRTFYNYESTGFGRGQHTLTFTEQENDGNNWVSNIAIHEYAEGFNFDPEFIGAYPVFSQSGSIAGYRPTNETCLMRDMESVRFCPVCQENNWVEFFQRVTMIDDLTQTSNGDQVTATVTTLKLGQLRKDGNSDTGRVEIRWSRNNQPVDTLNDMETWTLPASEARGSWTVTATYQTPEVRKIVISARKSMTVR